MSWCPRCSEPFPRPRGVRDRVRPAPPCRARHAARAGGRARPAGALTAACEARAAPHGSRAYIAAVPARPAGSHAVRPRASAARVSSGSPAESPQDARPQGPASAPHAPSGPPLLSNPPSSTAAEEGAAAAPRPEADPLVSNGLDSPLCEGRPEESELAPSARRDCETSGFAAASAPTGNYGLDVHIDTGLLDLSEGGLLTAVQDLFITPVWMALVWAVHALVVMLEWCFQIDLLDSAGVSAGVGAGLRAAQRTFTDPWLALVLALASVLALYNGLIRRRVAETLGQAALALAMMAGGTWVMLDPTATVGALGLWANQASLGTLAASAAGTPAGAGQVLSDSMATVLPRRSKCPGATSSSATSRWCRDPARLDPRLHAAALRIAAAEIAAVGCRSSAQASVCVARGQRVAKALEHSAELLRTATTNGAIFLALPANGPLAQLDQRRRLAAQDDVPDERSHPLSRADGGRGRVPHQLGHGPAGRRVVADRRRRSWAAAVARLHRVCACSPRRCSACCTCC